MRNFLVICVLLLFIGGAGYLYYGRQATSINAPASGGAKLTTDTVIGMLKPGKGSDFSYILITDSGKTVGIASQTTDLSRYVNKRLEITGSYSGTTLYAYTITELER